MIVCSIGASKSDVYIPEGISARAEPSLDDPLAVAADIFFPDIGGSHFAVELPATFFVGVITGAPVPIPLGTVRYVNALCATRVHCDDVIGFCRSVFAHLPVAADFLVNSIAAPAIGNAIQVKNEQSVRADVSAGGEQIRAARGRKEGRRGCVSGRKDIPVVHVK